MGPSVPLIFRFTVKRLGYQIFLSKFYLAGWSGLIESRPVQILTRQSHDRSCILGFWLGIDPAADGELPLVYPESGQPGGIERYTI
jgi:hypothetical protein